VLNKYCYVEARDDGCSLYECLACRNQWEIRVGMKNWKWCPFCGTEWEGELEWDIQKKFEKPYDNPRSRKDRLRNLAQVNIQERFVESGAEPQDDWRTVRTIAADAAPWYLELYRNRNGTEPDEEEWLGRLEYRAVKHP